MLTVEEKLLIKLLGLNDGNNSLGGKRIKQELQNYFVKKGVMELEEDQGFWIPGKADEYSVCDTDGQ